MRNTAYPYPAENRSLGQAPRRPPSRTKTIPFDYVFEFALTGERGNKVQDVLEISVEGAFVATSIGYSLVLDEQTRPRVFEPVIDARTAPRNPVFVPFFATDSSFPALDGILVAGMPEAQITLLRLDDTSGDVEKAIIEIRADGSVSADFRNAVGESTNAETDTIGIGSDGTIEIDIQRYTGNNGSPVTSGIIRVWDRTNGLVSEPFQVDSPTSAVIGPDPTSKTLPRAGDNTVRVYGFPDDIVTVFVLETATGNTTRVNDPGIPLERSEDVFSNRTGSTAIQLAGLGRPLSSGDALLVRSQTAPPQEPNNGDNGDNGGPIVRIVDPFSMFTIPRPRPSAITLGALEAGLETIGSDLTDGFRLNPNSANLLVADLPLDQSIDALAGAFETGAVAAEEVSFLYSIDVVGTGRELQSQPIHNIAGLGIANGDRPFRPFAKPILFAPRSSTRIQIEELSGPPGTLYIVLQGYKMLGTTRIPE